MSKTEANGKQPVFIRSVSLTLDERIALTSAAMKQGQSVAQYVESLIRAALAKH